MGILIKLNIFRQEKLESELVLKLNVFYKDGIYCRAQKFGSTNFVQKFQQMLETISLLNRARHLTSNEFLNVATTLKTICHEHSFELSVQHTFHVETRKHLISVSNIKTIPRAIFKLGFPSRINIAAMKKSAISYDL